MKLTVGRLRQIIRETVGEAEGAGYFYGDFVKALGSRDRRAVVRLVGSMVAAGLSGDDVGRLLDRAGRKLGWDEEELLDWDEVVFGVLSGSAS